MPKETFFNLPQDKRIVIQEAALNEFADHGFEAASINRIVAAAGIAKGSFYQYFEDKGDLYKQILAYIGEKKMAYISPVLMNPAEHDFFKLLEEVYRSGLAFAQDHPVAVKLSFEAFENKTNPLFREMMEENRQAAYGFYEPLLDTAIERGEVDPAIDKPFVLHMMMQMQLSSLDYFLESNKEDGMRLDIMPTINLMLNFIKNGIGRRSDEIGSNNKGETLQ